MQLIGYGKEYYRQLKSNSGLQQDERGRCLTAVRKFLANPQSPGLNFERLSEGARKNHYSIRASRELRLILAVNPPVEPVEFAPVNMGHHDTDVRMVGKARLPYESQRSSGGISTVRFGQYKPCRPPAGL